MVIGLWYIHDPNLGSLTWFWRCKEHPCPLSPHLGLWMLLEVPNSGFASWSWFGYGLWYTHDPNFGSISWFLRFKEHPRPLSPPLGLWRTLEVPYWDLVYRCRFGYGNWSLIHLWSKFWLSVLILKVQRTSISFKSSFGAFEDPGGSWMGFDIMIVIWIGCLIQTWSKFWLFLEFEGTKNIHVL